MDIPCRNITHPGTAIEEPPLSVSGTYIFLSILVTGREIQVGKLGLYKFEPGYYLYVGSAFGPGGLNARIARHLKPNKTLRWHFDYLRRYTNPVEIWYSTVQEKLECRWSRILSTSGEIFIPCKNIGASDCRCTSHLFYCNRKPDVSCLEK